MGDPEGWLLSKEWDEIGSASLRHLLRRTLWGKHHLVTSPERRLVAAMVLEALKDLDSKHAELRADAARFFADRTDTPWSSWGWAAGVLDMDVDLPGLARGFRPRSGRRRGAMKMGLGVPESAPEIGGVPGSIRADREDRA